MPVFLQKKVTAYAIFFRWHRLNIRQAKEKVRTAFVIHDFNGVQL